MIIAEKLGTSARVHLHLSSYLLGMIEHGSALVDEPIGTELDAWLDDVAERAEVVIGHV
jgi:hypothetical protein